MQTLKRYSILSKANPKDFQIKIVDSLHHLRQQFESDSVLAIDFETCGTNIESSSCYPVGVGVANSKVSCYLKLDFTNTNEFCQWILRKNLVVFNAVFDVGWIYRYTQEFPNIICDCYPTFWHLACEGYAGQLHSLKVAMVDLLGWEEPNTEELYAWLKANNLPREKMYLAPTEILGKYCALDTIATFHLYEYFLEYFAKFPGYKWYHTELVIPLIKLVIEQQILGVKVDEVKLKEHRNSLASVSKELISEFLTHKSVAPFIMEYQKAVIAEKERTEPARLNKNGTESARWIGWSENLKKIKAKIQFNINSKKQLQWLFYDRMKLPIPRRTEGGDGAVSKQILHLLGSPGKILRKYNEITKEDSYAKACENMLVNSILHTKFKVPGTVTGRLAGAGGFNWQQQPKKYGYLQCFTAREGYKLVEIDLSALEPKVCTQFSKDPSMWKLYGPAAKQNDIYLFVGAHIKFSRDKIRQWYDPDNPTKESIKDAKDNCKQIRQLIKVCTLAMQYGAQPKKLKETVELQGFDLSYSDAEDIFNDYWNLFNGIRRLELSLKQKFMKNNGWFLNGAGRPITLDIKYVKDILNRFVQSTGHDVLVFLLKIIADLRSQRKLAMTPWLVDFHDETIWECPEDRCLEAKKLMEDAVSILNEQLKWDIKMSGEVEIADNLAEIKCKE